MPHTPAAGKPAYRDANVLRWLAAYSASMLGDGVYFLALGWAAQKTAGPAEVGMVMAAGSVPRAVLMLGGGVVADRLGPRRVVIGSDAVRCLLILAAAAGVALASPGLWLLLAVALAFGVVDALFLPAVGALPAYIATPDQLARIAGLRALSLRIGNTVAPPLAGFASVAGGPGAAFAVAGLLFGVSVPLLIRVGMKAPDGERRAGSRSGTAGRDLVDGLRYIRGHRLIGPLVLSGAICELGMNGPLNVGAVLLAAERGWGAAGLGWIVGAFGLGAGAGSLLLAVAGRLPRAGAVQSATVAASGAAFGCLALAPSLPLAMGAAAFSGLSGGICGSLAYALIQTATEPGFLGRVTAVLSLTGMGLAPLSFPLVGAAIGAWGTTPVFLACGAFSCLGAVVGFAAPAVRRAELPRRRHDVDRVAGVRPPGTASAPRCGSS